MLFLCMIASVNSFYHSLSIDTEILLSAMQRNLINGIIELNFSGNFFFLIKSIQIKCLWCGSMNFVHRTPMFMIRIMMISLTDVKPFKCDLYFQMITSSHLNNFSPISCLLLATNLEFNCLKKEYIFLCVFFRFCVFFGNDLSAFGLLLLCLVLFYTV